MNNHTVDDNVNAFNAKYKVGDKVQLRLDDGSTKEVVVRHKATSLYGRTAVGWFEGITGCYSLDRVINK